MTGKYVLPSALSSQETVRFGSFSLLLLHFHTQCSAPEHNPPPLAGTWDGSSTPKGGTQPHALLHCVVLHSSGLLISDHDSLSQLGEQCSFISPKAGWPLRQTYLQQSSDFRQGFASAISRGWPHWQWGLSSEGTLPNPRKILHGKNGV